MLTVRIGNAQICYQNCVTKMFLKIPLFREFSAKIPIFPPTTRYSWLLVPLQNRGLISLRGRFSRLFQQEDRRKSPSPGLWDFVGENFSTPHGYHVISHMWPVVCTFWNSSLFCSVFWEPSLESVFGLWQKRRWKIEEGLYWIVKVKSVSQLQWKGWIDRSTTWKSSLTLSFLVSVGSVGVWGVWKHWIFGTFNIHVYLAVSACKYHLKLTWARHISPPGKKKFVRKFRNMYVILVLQTPPSGPRFINVMAPNVGVWGVWKHWIFGIFNIHVYLAVSACKYHLKLTWARHR